MGTSFIEHVVLFRFKEDVTPAQRHAMYEGLRGLKASVPGIIDLTVGDNFTDRGKGYACGLVVRLAVSLDAYQNHPEHQRVLQTLIKPIVADVIAVDYHSDR
jgi:hypothetical protein